MMSVHPSRTARLEARIAPEAASRAIESAQIVRLSAEDQRAIAASIAAPPPLTSAMKRAVARHRKVLATPR